MEYDMLLSTPDMPKPKRVQAAFITDDETLKAADFIRTQRPPQYDDASRESACSV